MGKINKNALGVLAVIFGILVLIKPDLLSWIVGLYLIIVGVSNLLS